MNMKKGNLEATDKKYLWHPFTQMKDWLANNIVIIEKGKGNYLYDTKGRRYLDGISSLWCNVHGHQVKEIDRAVKAQLSKVAHSTMLGLSNVPAIELAEKLIEIAPQGLSRVFYSDSGSTAVEIALKMAFQYCRQSKLTGKKRFLTFINAYHGDTIGSVSLGGMELFHNIYKPLLFDTIKAPAPYCYRCPMGKDKATCKTECLKRIEGLVEKHNKELTAIVIEPLIQGAAGMITQPRGFIKAIRQMCDKHNILMIADEVATGFGRTGKMFACQHEGVSPDIMCVAKGITGGYLPLAATITTEKIFRAFLGEIQDKKTFFHGHTYTGNPLACAAALANLKKFKRDKVINRLQPKIKLLGSLLHNLTDLPNVGEIRQCGLMVGIELVKDKITKAEFPSQSRIGHQVILKARKLGVILRPLGDVIVLMPPLSISEKEIRFLVDVVRKSITEVMSGS